MPLDMASSADHDMAREPRRTAALVLFGTKGPDALALALGFLVR